MCEASEKAVEHQVRSVCAGRPPPFELTAPCACVGWVGSRIHASHLLQDGTTTQAGDDADLDAEFAELMEAEVGFCPLAVLKPRSCGCWVLGSGPLCWASSVSSQQAALFFAHP